MAGSPGIIGRGCGMRTPATLDLRAHRSVRQHRPTSSILLLCILVATLGPVDLVAAESPPDTPAAVRIEPFSTPSGPGEWLRDGFPVGIREYLESGASIPV